MKAFSPLAQPQILSIAPKGQPHPGWSIRNLKMDMSGSMQGAGGVVGLLSMTVHCGNGNGVADIDFVEC